MKESIKKRIEAVRRGEVPEGYCKVHPYVIPYDWNVVKLGNVTKQTSRSNKDGQGRPAYSINNRKGFVPQSEQFEEGSYEDLDKTAYKIVRKGEFAYNPARVNVGSIGRLRDAEEVAVSSLYVCVRVDDKVDGEFFNAWTKSRDFYKETVRNTEGSVREYLFYENFANMRIPIPTVAEQQKIAEILETCDRMIERKQSKIDELKKLKQVCLLEMFPQKGQTIPKRRFPGFSAPWEQRKLGELIREISTGKSVNSDEGIVGADNIGVLKTSCVSYDHFDPSESKSVVKDERHLVKCSVEEDSVIVSRMNTPERVGACGYVERSIPNLFLPDRLWKLKFQENVNTYFLYTMLISGGYKEKITSMASGTSGSMYNIPKDAFLNLRLTLSLDIDEQKKIGDYFKQLDRLITLHQRELAEVGKYKEALMQLLLTGLVRVNA